jgi:hypothetical protein
LGTVDTVEAAAEETVGTSTGVSLTRGLERGGSFFIFSGSGTGSTGATTGPGSSFGVFAIASTGATGVPQDSQNLTPGASAAPHFMQDCRGSIFAPHDSQNFISGATGLPHFEQVLGFSIMNIHQQIWHD